MLKLEVHLDDTMLATCCGVRLNVSNDCLAANSDDWNLLVAAVHSQLPIQCLVPNLIAFTSCNIFTNSLRNILLGIIYAFLSCHKVVT